MIRFTLKQLEVFDSIAELGSVSAAARKLSLTQSAVSMSLSQLEKLLDRPLFIRQGNRLTLSHWGNWLRPKARCLLLDARQIESGLHDKALVSGVIRVGCSQTPAEHLVPKLISNIDTNFPELRIELDIENTEHVVEGVLNYDYELGIIESRYDDSRIHHENWLDDHLVVIASPHHPYAGKKSISNAQLEQAKWVLREHGAGTRGIFDGAIHGLVDSLNVWKEYEHVTILKSLVKSDDYLSAVPYLDVEKDVQAGKLVILPTPQLDMHRSISFIWRKNGGDTPLRNCILAEGRRLVRGRKVPDVASLESN